MSGQGKQADLFAIQAAQSWSNIREDDLPADDTWVIVRDNKAYHTVHRFHPYFAMCPPPIARLAIERFSRAGDFVVDPFCGAGVTQVEAMICGRPSLGVDILSMARFITKVKTTLVDLSMDEAMSVVDRAVQIARSTSSSHHELPAIHNVDYWFTPDAQQQLAAMLVAVKSEPDSHKRDFYLLAISSVVRPLSKSGNLESHLHIKRGKPIPNGFKLFRQRLFDMVTRERHFARLLPPHVPKATVHDGDCRDLSALIPDEAADLVFTSPPYGTGTKYASVYRLQMQLLGLPKTRGALETTKDFAAELRKSFAEVHRILRSNGRFALLYGTNRQFSSRDIAALATDVGFDLVTTIACPVIDESKMVRGDYKRSMANEHLLILTKQ
jgi:DNA modification methylase